MSELKELSQYIPVQYIIWVILIICALVVLVVKLAPSIQKAFDKVHKKVNESEHQTELVEQATTKIEDLIKMVSGLEEELSKIDYKTNLQQMAFTALENENELIIGAVLSVIRALQDMGAGNATNAIENEIIIHLNRKSHDVDKENILFNHCEEPNENRKK